MFTLLTSAYNFQLDDTQYVFFQEEKLQLTEGPFLKFFYTKA
jgi:hypothetical protein